MHICELVRLMPTHGAGGMQAHAALLARMLVKQGCRVTVLTAAAEDRDDEEIDGVRVVYVSGARPERHTAAGWVALQRAWDEIHARDPFAIVHAHSSAAEGWRRPRGGPPLVVTMHGTHWSEWLTSMRSLKRRRTGQIKSSVYLSMAYLFVAARYLPRAEALIFPGATDLERARWQYPRPRRKVLIPNGVDTTRFRPDIPAVDLHAELAIPPGAPIVVGTGRLVGEKGFRTAVEALAGWTGTMPYLVLIGDGPARDELHGVAQRSGVGDYLRLLPAVRQEVLPGYLNAADLFVFPTWREEGAPNALLEAMACGLPIVASDLGGVRVLAMHDHAAVLVSAMDSAALRGAMERMLVDRATARRLGTAARQRAVSQFGADQMATATHALFASIVEGRTGA
ncbi:MAG: glycosyltransferase family 1 protein [Herpetosiphon sp.]